MPFAAPSATINSEDSIPFEFTEYLKLVDSSGRAILLNKRGAIPRNTPDILHRLGFDEAACIKHMLHFEKQFATAFGGIDKMKQLAEQTGRRWIRDMNQGFVARSS